MTLASRIITTLLFMLVVLWAIMSIGHAATDREYERAVESHGRGVTRENACFLNALDLRPCQSKRGWKKPKEDRRE